MKTFYIKCTHLFKTKEAALAAGISPWDMWEVSRDEVTEAVTLVGPVQAGPVIPNDPPADSTGDQCEGSDVTPPDEYERRIKRHRRKK